LEQAAATDLDVTVLVRNPEKLPATKRAARVVTGDICTDSPAVRSAFAGQDAVISAIGVGKSFKPEGLIARAAPVIVAAMREHGVRRLVFVSAFGIGSTWQDTPLLPRLFMKTMLRDIYADKTAGEQVIRDSKLEWTIVYPTGLTDGARTDKVRVGERLSLRGFPTVARADVAATLLRQLEDRSFVGKGILVAS
jgi:putative NADH-flavin reductase